MSTSKSVFLADDHIMFLEALTAYLQAQPSLELVGQCSNGSDAWEQITRLRPDITVADITMPGLTGIELARRNAAAGFPTRTVLVTMHDDRRLAQEALDAGAGAFVLKQNTLAELSTAVQTVIAGGTFVSPSMRALLPGRRRSPDPVALLSVREREVLRLMAHGLSSKQIAREMDISPRTVDTYRRRLADKLELDSLAEMVRYAVKVGLVD